MFHQNNGVQLKNFGVQLNDIGIQIQNMGIQMQNISQDIRIQMQTLGSQISNIGIQVFNIGTNFINQIMQMNMMNEMNNVFMEQNLYGKNNINNFNNNNFNIENNRIINIIFQNNERKQPIKISEINTIEELINIYFKRIEMNPDIEKNKFWFNMNSYMIQPDNKTKIKDFKLPNGFGLSDGSLITVIRKKDVTN